jgi:hypothetical protein
MVFSKRKNGGVEQLEAELGGAQAKRTKLRERLAAAEAALNEAIAVRRTALLEGGADEVGDSHDIVAKGTDRDTIADALEALDVRIKDIDSRLAAERSRGEYEAAAGELAGRINSRMRSRRSRGPRRG